MRLISMTDFVLSEIKEPYTDSERLRVITNYASFLKQPLKLEMFVPCDDEGNVLEEPNPENYFNTKTPINELSKYDSDGLDRYHVDLLIFEDAREKVLFKRFEIEGNYLMYYGFMYSMIYELDNKTIENIIDYIPNNPLQLTPTALKQIGL